MAESGRLVSSRYSARKSRKLEEEGWRQLVRKELDAEDVDRAAVMNPVARLEMFAPTGEEWSSAGIGTCLPVELCIRPR